MEKNSPKYEPLPPYLSDFVKKAAIVVGMVLSGVVLLILIGLTIRVLFVAFAGILLGVFFLALRDFVAKYTHLPEGWSLALVIFLLLAFLGAQGYFLAPQLAEQIDEFGRRLPAFVERVENIIKEYGWGRQLREMVRGDEAITGIHKGIGTFVTFTIQGLGFLVTFIAVGFFLAVRPKLYFEGAVRLMPIRWRPRTREVLGEIGSILRWFLVARAIAMFLVGVSTAVVLMLLGVPLALLLGVIAGLLTFIPYLGPIAAGVPIILVAVLEGFDIAIYALIAYTIIQQIEGTIFDPLILQRVIRLAPVVTLLSQILGAVLLGPLGIALATPLAAVVQVLIRTVYREDILGEPRGDRGG
jgi:predicted PurR-regulated permease PerM